MEKIIAVVIMVVIVIGLIAVVVMPQSKQVTEMGGQAQGQLSGVASTMTGSGTTQVSTAQVVSEISTNLAEADYYMVLNNTTATPATIATTSTGLGAVLYPNGTVAGSLYANNRAVAATDAWVTTTAGTLGIATTTYTPLTVSIPTTGTYLRTQINSKNSSGVARTFVLFQKQ